jgi:hypothetical protein
MAVEKGQLVKREEKKKGARKKKKGGTLDDRRSLKERCGCEIVTATSKPPKKYGW